MTHPTVLYVLSAEYVNFTFPSSYFTVLPCKICLLTFFFCPQLNKIFISARWLGGLAIFHRKTFKATASHFFHFKISLQRVFGPESFAFKGAVSRDMCTVWKIDFLRDCRVSNDYMYTFFYSTVHLHLLFRCLIEYIHCF